MDYDFCCRPPAPVPQRTARCWVGALKNQHEQCCLGTREGAINGPRGNVGCWVTAAVKGELGLSALLCCDFAAGYGGARCLSKAYATTCSFPDVKFRAAVPRDIHNTRGLLHIVDVHRDPIAQLWRYPGKRHPEGDAYLAHFLTLGVGAYIAAAERLRRQAVQLNVFGKVHAHTNFDFATEHNRNVFAEHLRAWKKQNARIAGFGWWKPVLCKHHLESLELPSAKGMLVYSDAGSVLELVSKSPWVALLDAMRFYDVMAVVDTNFVERLYTKQKTLARFADALRGTQAAREGQFVTTLFAFRKTYASLRLLNIWEELVSDIQLVDETLSPSGEDLHFRAHRHEQSVWSLLLKCAILGRALPMDGGGSVNVSARVLIVNKDYEAFQLADFRRTPRNPTDAIREHLMRFA